MWLSGLRGHVQQTITFREVPQPYGTSCPGSARRGRSCASALWAGSARESPAGRPGRSRGRSRRGRPPRSRSKPQGCSDARIAPGHYRRAATTDLACYMTVHLWIQRGIDRRQRLPSCDPTPTLATDIAGVIPVARRRTTSTDRAAARSLGLSIGRRDANRMARTAWGADQRLGSLKPRQQRVTTPRVPSTVTSSPSTGWTSHTTSTKSSELHLRHDESEPGPSA